MCSGITVGTTMIANHLKVGLKISGVKEKYLKYEASGYHNGSSKVTGHSEMTVKFVILHDFFEIETGED